MSGMEIYQSEIGKRRCVGRHRVTIEKTIAQGLYSILISYVASFSEPVTTVQW